MIDYHPSKETQEKWIIDPSNWKWGIFYYNPADKRIFPPKRFKALGWTVNFANPISILSLAAVLSAIYFFSKFVLN